MRFVTKTFEALTNRELYAVLQLRSLVFVVEQQCPYQDMDEVDLLASHNLMVDENDRITGYTRCIPPGIKYDAAAAIGRVVTHPDIRKQGWGVPLMEYAMEQCRMAYPGYPVRISAQLYLLEFYERLGFVPQGEQYLEDDIPHIEMLLS